MQPNLFDIADEKPQQKKELAIIKQGKQILTKQQKDFNRLVKKIEKLRADLGIVGEALNKKLAYYATEMYPLEQRVVPLRTTCVKIFFQFYTGEKKFLTKNEKEVLRDLMEADLDEIFSLSPVEPDDELKAIYKAISGESYEESKKDAFNEMKEEMEAQFRSEGFDINLDDINENMSEAEMFQKMKEMQDEFERQAEENTEKKANRKKTKKQLAQEEREKQIEEVRKKSISSIYKQLAKAFHPDLETDEMVKLQKEDIMKQLTVAYENNDLHTLLKLEMEWMQKETNDPGKLSNDQLGIYNEALKEQVMELEMQIDMLADHPRYMPLQRFADTYAPLHTINLVREKKEIEKILITLEETEPELKGKNALKVVKEIIQSCKEDTAVPDDMDALLKEFLKGFR